VHAGSVLDVATMDAELGSRVELRDILLIADGDNVTFGSPLVDDAVVVAEIVGHGKGRKVINFKYKAKTRYRRKRGHRQGFTKLAVREISFGGNTTTDKHSQRQAAVAAGAGEEPRGFSGRAEAEPEAEAAAPRGRASRRGAAEQTAAEEPAAEQGQAEDKAQE
jgi:large subunit ribosomal protein L21